MRYLSLTLATIMSGCVSSGKPEFKAAEVIERIGEKSESPEWTTADKVMFDEGSNVVFVSQISMSGNSRTEACMKASELDGRSAMSKFISEAITTSGQLNESDVTGDPGFESLTAFLAQNKLSGIRVEERYWEKRLESNEAGERVLKIRCLSKLAIKKSELERQLRAATGQGGGNPDVRNKLIEAQKSFIENVSQQSAPAH